MIFNYSGGTGDGKYLPLTGGTAENFGVDVHITIGQAGLAFKKSGVINQYLTYDHNGGDLKRWGTDFSAKTILDTGNMASHVLPLTGGMIKNSSSAPFGITNTNGNEAYIPFIGSDGKLGYLGFFGKDNPVCKNSANAMIYPLLHTGNSSKVVISQTAPSDTNALWVY